MPYKAIAQSRERKGFSRATIVGNIAQGDCFDAARLLNGYQMWISCYRWLKSLILRLIVVVFKGEKVPAQEKIVSLYEPSYRYYCERSS